MKDLRSFLVDHGFVERDANFIDDEESLVMSYKDLLRVAVCDNDELFLYINKDGVITIQFEYEEDLIYYILGFLEGSSLYYER